MSPGKRSKVGIGGRGTVRVGVLGLGFMGRTHLAAYRDAKSAGFPCEVVAVCDRDRRAPDAKLAGNLRVGAARGGLYDERRVARYDDARGLLADPNVDLVSICTNTESHAELAIAALEAGKHVLVEKPVALDSRAVAKVAASAAAARTLCMPALCMRFWPGWSWLREQVAKGRFGAVRSAAFQRLSAPPDWSKAFYRDPRRTGGALVDLHIHDADFVRSCFGDPKEVSSAGSLDHVTTLYRFERGPAHVVAEGGWDHTPGFAFRMRYVVIFEDATADYDLLRPEPLVLSRGGKCEAVPLPPGMGYDFEVRHLVAAIAAGSKALDATIDDALAVARLLEAERRSLEAGRPARVSRPAAPGSARA